MSSCSSGRSATFIASAVALVLASWTAVSNDLVAAELRLNVSGTYRSLDIEGTIEPGDYERFVKIVKENQGQLSGVHLYSPGGDFVEAMKIGRALRALELSSMVPMRGRDGRPVCEELLGSKPRDSANCTAVGAAFFVHIGGSHRGGTYLAVHRPQYDPRRLTSLSQAQAERGYSQLTAEARAYMKEMGLPTQIQEQVLNTPSDRQAVLDEQLIRTHIWGDLSYRDEWRRAKCNKLSAPEAERLRIIGSRLLAGERPGEMDSAELSRLRNLEDQQSRCNIQLVQESRSAAYERFFGLAPSDVANHNFSRWLDAPKYLGRTFEDVASEERFEPETPMGATSILRRKETSTSPPASLMDIGNNRRIVSWVAVLKENPSAEFRQRVQATLEASWGAPKTVADQLLWTSRLFRARLEYDRSRRDPSLVLTVEPTPSARD
jgi:hypothetical protein